MNSNFFMLRDANVEVREVQTGTGKSRTRAAEIVVNGEFHHRFDPKSRYSKHLDVMTPTDLGERLSRGSFFFIDEEGGGADTAKLVDLRDGQYNGHVHTDDTIQQFMDLLGYTHKNSLPLHRRKKSDVSESPIVLRKEWSNGEIEVPGYAEGGQYSSRLSFVWNPFTKTINSSFDLIRLICTNGAIGLTSFLNTKIPLENRWQEGLDIASRQIQNKVSTIVIDRVQTMATERASVGDCLLLEQHLFDRLYAPIERSQEERERLLTLMAAVSPRHHLSGVYQDSVFGNKSLASQVPSHLSYLDLWHVATEIRSHSGSSAKSTDNALDRFANQLMFEDPNFTAAHAATLTSVKHSSFADPERAFWGRID